jgi:uncharacterized protein Yka (UPF0111/DUF47 family)
MPLVDHLKRLKNIRLLPPREKEFYIKFNEMADTVLESSEFLIKLFEARASERPELEIAIATRITRINQMASSLENLLRTAQQPPFGRSEISEFSDGATRIVKYIEHAANRFVVYDFPSSDKEMREMAPLIREACVEIVNAVKALNKNRNLEPYLRAIDSLEGKADEIYHEGLRRRFREIRVDHARLDTQIKHISPEAACKELLPIITANVEYTRHVAVFFALRQVYAELERAIDACTDLAAILKRMVAANV